MYNYDFKEKNESISVEVKDVLLEVGEKVTK